MEKTNEATPKTSERPWRWEAVFSRNVQYYRLMSATNRIILRTRSPIGQDAELIVKAVNAYDSLVAENERLKELMSAEHCPSLPDCYKVSKQLEQSEAENQKLREVFGNCICSVEQYGSLGDSDLEKYKEVLKAKNV